MDDLFALVSGQYKFHLELLYSSTCDWMLKIYRRNKSGKDVDIFNEQNVDIQYLISKAQVAIKDHLLENYGGY